MTKTLEKQREEKPETAIERKARKNRKSENGKVKLRRRMQGLNEEDHSKTGLRKLVEISGYMPLKLKIMQMQKAGLQARINNDTQMYDYITTVTNGKINPEDQPDTAANTFLRNQHLPPNLADISQMHRENQERLELIKDRLREEKANNEGNKEFEEFEKEYDRQKEAEYQKEIKEAAKKPVDIGRS